MKLTEQQIKQINDLKKKGMTAKEVSKEFLNKIIEIIGDNINFYALDVAQTEDGNWIVIELNDGQMSGLSENNPEILYKKLREVL